MLLKLKAKVNLFQSEEQMEAQGTYDLGHIAQSKEWVWRDMGVPVETVYRVVAFNSSKTLVFTEDENGETEQILVAEKFDDVYEKWRVALYEYYQKVDVGMDYEEEQTEEDLTIGDEEDED